MRIILLVAVLLVAGCTFDRTAGVESAICQVHRTEMKPEVIRVMSYESVYVPEYMQQMRREFPNHGDWRMQNEPEVNMEGRFYPNVRDFVCPECNEAWSAYWEEREARIKAADEARYGARSSYNAAR